MKESINKLAPSVYIFWRIKTAACIRDIISNTPTVYKQTQPCTLVNLDLHNSWEYISNSEKYMYFDVFGMYFDIIQNLKVSRAISKCYKQGKRFWHERTRF